MLYLLLMNKHWKLQHTVIYRNTVHFHRNGIDELAKFRGRYLSCNLFFAALILQYNSRNQFRIKNFPDTNNCTTNHHTSCVCSALIHTRCINIVWRRQWCYPDISLRFAYLVKSQLPNDTLRHRFNVLFFRSCFSLNFK